MSLQTSALHVLHLEQKSVFVCSCCLNVEPRRLPLKTHYTCLKGARHLRLSGDSHVRAAWHAMGVTAPQAAGEAPERRPQWSASMARVRHHGCIGSEDQVPPISGLHRGRQLST